MTSLDHQLETVLREFFKQDSLEISDAMSLKDVPGWDSLAHVNLINTLENEFTVRFSVRDLIRMTTIGGIKRALESKLSSPSH